MERLIKLHRQHDSDGIPVEVESAWLHHAFTQIHPFQDGNGRVARTISSLLLLKAGLFPFVITRDDRTLYIEYLEAADAGDLEPLLKLVSRLQKRMLTKAIGFAAAMRPSENVDEAIKVVKNLLTDLGQISQGPWIRSKNVAHALLLRTQARSNYLIQKLKEEIGRVETQYRFTWSGISEPPEEVNVLARKLGYDPNFAQFNESVQLNLAGPAGTSKIVISFHGVGSAFRGLLVVSAFFHSVSKEPISLSEDVFRISYEEPIPELQTRFLEWLEVCLTKGIGLWRQTLV